MGRRLRIDASDDKLTFLPTHAILLQLASRPDNVTLCDATTICIFSQACKKDLLGSDSAGLTTARISMSYLLAQLCGMVNYKRPRYPAKGLRTAFIGTIA